MDKKIRKGLILEGGAMRGMFTSGVLDVFMEKGIQFDGLAGISAGAIFGCNYKSHQIGRGIRYNKRFCKDPRYCSLRSLIFTGDLYGAKFCYSEIPEKLDVFDTDTFAKDPMEFYVGATDARTGRPVYHRCRTGGKKDMRWIRASASLPLVSRAVRVDGYELLDGGISDSVPYAFMESKGFNRNVIILTQPEGYTKKPGKAGAVLKLLLRKYPEAAKAMAARSEMYNKQMRGIALRELAGEVLVIRPEKSLGISRTENDPKELERVYQLGRAAGEKWADKVESYLNS